ncbi:MAG: hypothetical protein LC798_13055 [Chloroflexi bacterium]|nr:hypothetical protein [Chloroflexota bacterium]
MGELTFLDGSYDRDEVEACRYHPNHRWTVIRMGDVREFAWDPDELHVICQGCFVPRCGHATYLDREGNVQWEENPCLLPRHHRELHLYADGSIEDPSVWPGDEKPDPPDLPILSEDDGFGA